MSRPTNTHLQTLALRLAQDAAVKHPESYNAGPDFQPHRWVTYAVESALQMGQRPTSFQLVTEMDLAFGNSQGDPLNPNWEKVIAQQKGIREENETELTEAIARRDPVAARDALCDVMVFALGAYHSMGYDADEDMEAVVAALFTRFCRDKEHLTDTVEHYTRNVKIEVYCGGEFPRMWVKSLYDQKGADGAVYPQDKFLKARGYSQPVFKPAVGGG